MYKMGKGKQREHFIIIQERQIKLEMEVEKQTERADKWYKRAKLLEAQIDTLRNNAINPDELEKVRIENDRLKMQIRNLERNSKAEKKLQAIMKILKLDVEGKENEESK